MLNSDLFKCLTESLHQIPTFWKEFNVARKKVFESLNLNMIPKMFADFGIDFRCLEKVFTDHIWV